MEAIFNDTRCYSEGACSFDPLLFTCTITGSGISFAIITLPTGQSVEIDQDNNIKGNERLPSGVTLQFHHVTKVDNYAADYTLILAIERASLLTGTVTCTAGDSLKTSDNTECLILTGI